MGASASWAYLRDFGAERVRAMVAVDQTPKMLNDGSWPHGFYGYTEANLDTYFAAGIPKTGHAPKRSPKTAMRMMKALGLSPLDLVRGNRLPPTALALLNDHARQDWRAVVTGSGVPTLLVAGRDSEFWPCEHATALASPSTDVRAVVIDHSGHAVNLEQPDEFNWVLGEFIRSLG